MLTDGRPCRHEQHTEHRRHLPHGTGAPLSDRFDAAGVTAEGAAWLASAGTYPRSTLALWEDRPTAPVVLPCGTAFDVVNAPAIFGRRMLDRLWDEGPGSGPVAVFRGRMLLFSAPGTAQRLPSLLEWEEWGSRGAEGSWDAWDSRRSQHLRRRGRRRLRRLHRRHRQQQGHQWRQGHRRLPGPARAHGVARPSG